MLLSVAVGRFFASCCLSLLAADCARPFGCWVLLSAAVRRGARGSHRRLLPNLNCLVFGRRGPVWSEFGWVQSCLLRMSAVWFGLVWFGRVCSVLVLLGQGSVGYGLVRFMIDFVSLCLVGFARVRSILVGFTWSNLGRVG